jgi:hypothetical protein
MQIQQIMSIKTIRAIAIVPATIKMIFNEVISIFFIVFDNYLFSLKGFSHRHCNNQLNSSL